MDLPAAPTTLFGSLLPVAAMRTAAALALALLATGCLGAGSPPLGSPVRAPVGDIPVLTTHAALLERLDALRAQGVEVEELGASVEGRAIPMLRLGEGPFVLWLAARHHGNEVTSTDAVLNVVDYLLGLREPGPLAFPITQELYAHRAQLLQALTIVAVPMVNADGAERDQRTNVNGQDLNRDYLLFRQPEPRAVREGFWRAWPDAGLDLHNEGLYGRYDYDAYYPEVPRAEAETQEVSLANQWAAVHELEAGGSYAGGPNENYVTSQVNDPCEELPLSIPVAPPTDDTNPTAYCEGTHDAFLTLRGAPGWTPEAALGYDDRDHALPTSLAWGIAQHEATIASTAFYHVGAYDACRASVEKHRGTLAAQSSFPLDAPGPGARFQLVWRSDVEGSDQPLDEGDLVVRTPAGRMLGPESHPLGFTETVVSPEAGAHIATVRGRSPAPLPYELRAYTCAPTGAALSVDRALGGLRVVNRGALPLEVEVQDSLVGEHALAWPGAEARVVQGPLAPKTLLAWHFSLAPGAERFLAAEAPEGALQGPARWHAHGPGGDLLLGTTGERGSPAPG